MSTAMEQFLDLDEDASCNAVHAPEILAPAASNAPETPAATPVSAPQGTALLPQVVAPDNGRSLSEFVTEVGRIIGPKQVWFVKNDRVVCIRDKSLSQTLRTTVFHPLDQHETRTAIEQHVELIRVSGKGKDKESTPASISALTALALLVSPQFKEQLPRVDRILKMPLPLIHEGKLVFTKPGYDERFLTYCSAEAPHIELSLEEAKATIREIFTGFCLQGESARMMALARFLTPFCRGLMGFEARPPIWIFEANSPRSGKDYLAGCTSILYEGFANEDAPLNKSSEETQKRIVSALQSGRRFMHFANCKGHIEDAAFEQAATAKIISARLLGRNDAGADLTAANEIEFSLSTNKGLTMTEDLNLRTRKISLVQIGENANGRTFQTSDLHGWINENRNRIIAALTKLVQHWDKVGRPHGPTPFTSFPEWAKVVGGIMAACELGDPCATQAETELTGDDNTKDMKALFELAHIDSQGVWITKRELKRLISELKDSDLFPWYDDDSKAHQTKLGTMLLSFGGRELGGIMMEVDSTDRKRRKFRFTRITETGSPGKESTSQESKCPPRAPCPPLTLSYKGVPLCIDIDDAHITRAVDVPEVPEVPEVPKPSTRINALLGIPAFPEAEPEPDGELVGAITGGVQ